MPATINTQQFSHLKHCLWTTTTSVTTGKIVDPLCIFKTNVHGFFIISPLDNKRLLAPRSVDDESTLHIQCF
jgi:hypothetical protein